MENPTAALVVRDNFFRSDLPARTIVVRVDVAVLVEMSSNTMIGMVERVSEAMLAK